jgi:hypothetical protein
MKKRTKVDIANEREIKKRELEELIEGIDKEEITPELQEKIDTIEEEITELEKELEEIEPIEPIEQNSNGRLFLYKYIHVPRTFFQNCWNQFLLRAFHDCYYLIIVKKIIQNLYYIVILQIIVIILL